MKRVILFILIMLLLALASCSNTPQEDKIQEISNDKASIQEAITLEQWSEPTSGQTEIQNTLELSTRKTVIPSEKSGGLTIIEIPIQERETLESFYETLSFEAWPDQAPSLSVLEINGDRISYRVDEKLGGKGEVSLIEITIFRNDQPIQTLSAGQGGPINTIWGFAAYEGSWFLEINRYEQPEEGMDDDTVKAMQIQGDIIQDGVSLNEREGYQESFGFTLISWKSILLFPDAMASMVIFMMAIEYPLDFTNIAHHQCCSGAQMNPRFFDERVVVFAGKGDQQYLGHARNQK